MGLSLLIIVFIPNVALAKEPEDFISEYSELIPSEIPADPTDTEALTESISLSVLVEHLISELMGRRGEIMAFYLLLLGIVALSSFGVCAFENMSDGVRRGISTISSVAVFSALMPLLSSVSEALRSANGFFSSAAPIICSISLASGASASAAVGASGISLTAALISTVSSRILPTLGAVGLISSLLGSFGGSVNIAESAKRLYMRIFGGLSLLISITFSMQSTVASAQDTALIRAAKYGASTLIPSVGGVVSSAMSTLLGGLSYAKGMVGASAVGVILYIFAAPFVLLLVFRFGLSVALSLCEIMGVRDISLSPFLSVMDVFISSYVISCLMFTFEIILLMKGGVGA